MPTATTYLKAHHISAGSTIAQSMKDRFDYGQNPEKTLDGALTLAYECDPKTADAEFLLSKAKYKAVTGREQKRDEDVLCYQIRQSFPPGELDAEAALKVGYELAMRWTKGNHAFFVVSHIDRPHPHCHIYYNSTSLDCTRKFRDFLGSARALRRLSDRVCIEHGLSTIKNPKLKSKGRFLHYGAWLGGDKPPTFQERLRRQIDAALAERPADFADFLRRMEAAGFEAKLRSGKGPGYERWAKVFNLKQMAAALQYLQENGLTDYAELSDRAAKATDAFHTLEWQIKSIDADLQRSGELMAAVVDYAKTRAVFDGYKASRYSRKYLAEHEADIQTNRAARAAFSRLLGGGKLPKMEALKKERQRLLAEKRTAYADFKKARAEMREVVTAKANIDRLLEVTGESRNKEMER